MNKDAIYKTLKGCNPAGKSKTLFFMAECVWDDVRKWHKAEIKRLEREEKDRAARAAEIDPMLQSFLDNPMTPEDEAKMLRATLHVGLAGGSIPPQLLDKLDKIIGVNSGKDASIEPVDFRDAFPDLARAIEICEHPKPES